MKTKGRAGGRRAGFGVLLRYGAAAVLAALLVAIVVVTLRRNASQLSDGAAAAAAAAPGQSQLAANPVIAGAGGAAGGGGGGGGGEGGRLAETSVAVADGSGEHALQWNPAVESGVVLQVAAPRRDRGGVRVAVMTMYNGLSAGRIGGPRDTHVNYARRNGYALIDAYALPSVQRIQSTLPGASAFFVKFYAILQVIPHYDAVLYIDQQMPFLNQSAGVEELLDVRFDVVAGAGSPTDPDMPQLCSTQSLLVRNTARAYELIQAVWALRKVDCRTDRDILAFQLTATATACTTGAGWWHDDMGAFNWLLRSRRSIGCRVRLVPLRELAAPFPSYGNGDRVLSLSRLTDEQRMILSEIFRDTKLDPNLEPPLPQYRDLIDPIAGVVDVARAPFLAPSDLEHYPRGPDAWKLYEPWNQPCI